MIKGDKLFGYSFQTQDAIILRDYLAIQRTRLANERTLLAYLRTSLYMVLGGTAFLQLEEFDQIRWVGHVAIGTSVVFLIIGTFRYMQIKFRLNRYYRDAGLFNNPGTKSEIE